MHPLPPSRDRLRGILFMIAAVFILSIMDALMKRLSSHYPPLQIACLRSLASWVCLLPAVAWQGSWGELRPMQPRLHAIRGFLGVVMLASFVFAVHRLTLAQTYSLFLAAPLLMTALSVPIHGERVSGRRWVVIVVGLSGVLLILQPWARSTFSWTAAGAAAIATVCYALSALSVRSMGPRNSSLSLVFWYLALVAIAAGVLAAGDWQRVAAEDWKWLAAIGVSGSLGQLWLTEAFRRAPPSVVAPFEYTSILWAFVIDWLCWSTLPSASLMVGAAVVIASGIAIVVDEHRLAGQTLADAIPPP